ncbi:MAG: hypothetical protein AAFU41_05630 [Pseudomonadota bacterium]
MNIVIGTIVLAILAGWLWQKLETAERRGDAIARVRIMTWMNLPRVVLALISAGLFAELLPDEIVRAYLGDTAGFTGVLLGAALGIVTPGGAFVSFALAAGAMTAGAALPAIIAYLTSWSLLSITKVLAEELAFLGGRFILIRYAFCDLLPIESANLS